MTGKVVAGVPRALFTCHARGYTRIVLCLRDEGPWYSPESALALAGFV